MNPSYNNIDNISQQETPSSNPKKDARDFLIKIQQDKNHSLVEQRVMSQIIEDRKNVLDLNILVCVDVSGSISSEQFSQFMAQINAIKGLSRVKVAEIDTEIVAFYNYFKVKRRVARLRGGGGTEFSPAFKLIEKIKPDAVLFMTDGEVAHKDIKTPSCPIGWILTKNGRIPYEFGEVVVRLS